MHSAFDSREISWFWNVNMWMIIDSFLIKSWFDIFSISGELLHSEMNLISSWTNWNLSQDIKSESEPGEQTSEIKILTNCKIFPQHSCSLQLLRIIYICVFRNQHGWSEISEPIVFKTSQYLVHPPQVFQ